MTQYGSGMGGGLSSGDSVASAAVYDRLRRTDVVSVVCLLSWLRCRGPSPAMLPGGSFSALAPTGELETIVFDVLQVSDFVVPLRPAGSVLRTASVAKSWCSPDWTLDPSMGAADAVGRACEDILGLVRMEGSETSLAAAFELWRYLAFAECSSYLTAELEQHHLDVHWATAARPAILKVIERLPASQGFYVCWLAVRDVASAYLKYPTSRDMLGVVLRNSVEQKMTRAQSERWSLRSFNRHPHCSESALASVFACGTRLQNAYLHEVPSLHLLESAWASKDS